MRRISIHVCELCVVLCLGKTWEWEIFTCTALNTIKNVLQTPTLKSKRPYYDSTLLQRLRTCAILVGLNDVNSIPHCVTVTQWPCMHIDTVLTYLDIFYSPCSYPHSLRLFWSSDWCDTDAFMRDFKKLKIIASICCNALSLMCS